tara:strand:+ start:2061 stop:2282 length:222 start_codon:yes stop_codon:yes gene_type:complete
MSEKVSPKRKLLVSIKAGCLVVLMFGAARIVSVDNATLANDWKLYVAAFLLITVGVYSSLSIGEWVDHRQGGN